MSFILREIGHMFAACQNFCDFIDYVTYAEQEATQSEGRIGRMHWQWIPSRQYSRLRKQHSHLLSMQLGRAKLDSIR
ncbi:hypothetical protein Mapa_001712 [Marchantia paleacea]|nr:hypothetical protein Mapa_001712 [Marchantia paleacea]